MFFVWYLNLLTSLGLGDVPILIFVKHGSADTLTLVKLNAWNWPHSDLKTSPNTTKPTITTKLTLELCSTTISLLWYHFSCFYHTFPLDGTANWCPKPAHLKSWPYEPIRERYFFIVFDSFFQLVYWKITGCFGIEMYCFDIQEEFSNSLIVQPLFYPVTGLWFMDVHGGRP